MDDFDAALEAQGELRPFLEEMRVIAADALVAPGDANLGGWLRLYASVLERLADGAANHGLLGLLDACLLLQGAMHERANQGMERHESLLQGLRVWPQLVDLYLGKHGLPATSVALVAFLRRPWWDLGLSDEDSLELEHALQDLPPSLTQDGLGELPHEIADCSADELGPESHSVADAEPPHEVAEFSASELPEEGMLPEPADPASDVEDFGSDEFTQENLAIRLTEPPHEGAAFAAEEWLRDGTAVAPADSSHEVIEFEIDELLADAAEFLGDEPGVEEAGFAGDELAGVELAGDELAGNELAGVELAGVELAGDELAGDELAGVELAGDELAGVDLVGFELAGNEFVDERAKDIEASNLIEEVTEFAAEEGSEFEAEGLGDALDDGVATTGISDTDLSSGLVSAAARDVLDVIGAEMPEIESLLASLLTQLDADMASDAAQDARRDTTETLSRVATAAQSVGLAGLARICDHAAANVERSCSLDRHEAICTLQPWRSLAGRIMAYLQEPFESAPGEALVGLASDARISEPLSSDQADELGALLALPDFSVLDEQEPARAQSASAQDVSLHVPEDVNPELLEGLLQELPQQTGEFSAAIQRLVKGGSMEDVIVAQRVAHTLKGAGNTVGVRGLAELTHQLEDILHALSKHSVLPQSALLDVMVNASDCLDEMAEHLLGIGPAPVDAVRVLQDVLDWANRIDQEGPSSGVPVMPITTDNVQTANAQVQNIEAQSIHAAADTEISALAGNARPVMHTDEWANPIQSNTDIERTVSDGTVPESGTSDTEEASGAILRVPAKIIDNLLRVVGEVTILNSQLHERLRRTRDSTRAMEDHFEGLRQLGAELERLVDVKDLSQSRGRRGETKFDALEMDEYNELHTYSRRLIESALDAREMGRGVALSLGEIDDMLTTQSSLNRDTQEGVLNTRLVSVKSVFPRLQRSARQTSRSTGKHVELTLSGGDTMMDSDVLAQFVDPLMHLLRNAIDHGIETAGQRSQLGKSAAGRISIFFHRDGNSILVRCSDDGAGLDYPQIRAAAERRGIIARGEEVSEQDLRGYILRPRFTTREEVTQTSGRGTGLDAVYNGVVALGGSLNVSSQPGQGCVFEARLPVTLLSSQVLLVRAAEQTVALTSRGLVQIMHFEDGELRRIGNDLVFQAGGQIYPAKTIEAVLGIPTRPEQLNQLSRYRSVLVVRGTSGATAVLVEVILASRELVVKTLGRYVPRLRGIVGATILGDGTVTPVIDIAELIREPVTFNRIDSDTTLGLSSENMRQPLALVVDDSLSARRSLALLLTDSGFRVETARDGIEAVGFLEKTRPDILFVDMEMPRMNGIELTSHVRSRNATAKMPVIMVTSRSTAKHREQAEAAGINAYVTKPFAEEALLERTHALLGKTA